MSHTIHLNRHIVIFCIALIVMGTLHCKRSKARASSDNSTVTVLYPWDERVLGPYMDVDAKFLVFLPLFYTDEHGHIQGKLAERWEHSEDYRSWTYYLRKDVKWHDEVPPPLPYDPDAAAQLLDEAGWPEDARGVRKRDGKEFRFDITIPSGYSAAGDYRGASVLIQAQLRQIGIQMDIQEMEEYLLSKRIESGQFQAAIHRFFQGPNMLLKWFGENSPLGYSNSRVLQLLREYQITADPEEVNRIVSEIQPLMAQDLPLTFLFPHIQTNVAHQRIKGLSSPYRAFPLQHMEHLWIEEE